MPLSKSKKMKITTTVIKGLGEGKKLGFPTINLKIPQLFELRPGVYACRLDNLPGALFYGERLTHGIQGMSLEVFLIQDENIFSAGRSRQVRRLVKKNSEFLENKKFRQGVYQPGLELMLEIGLKIRDNKKFRSLEALKKQIAVDVEKIKMLLGC